MNKRAVLTLAVAVLLAVVAVVLMRNQIAQQQAEMVPEPVASPDTVPVVVAAAPLRFGATLTMLDLKVIQWPSLAAPEGVFTSPEEIIGGDEPRVVLRPIEINEPILPAKVSGLGGRAALSAVIEEGKRATTIRVNDVNGVAGFVLPGDRVDVMLTRTKDDGEVLTEILLQDLRVLAVDQDNSADSELAVVVDAVTLEVSPRQAQRLALASQLGSLSLALRGEEATETVALGPVSTLDMDSKRKRQNGNSVRITRGVETSDYDVRKGGTVPPRLFEASLRSSGGTPALAGPLANGPVPEGEPAAMPRDLDAVLPGASLPDPVSAPDPVSGEAAPASAGPAGLELAPLEPVAAVPLPPVETTPAGPSFGPSFGIDIQDR